jgi:rhamnosyltransferase
MTPVVPTVTRTDVAAILVVYAGHSDPTLAMERLLAYCDLIVLVDNSEVGHPAVALWRNRDGVHTIHHRNRGGLAGAYNAAVEHITTHRKQITHVVFVDDDSDPTVLVSLLGDSRVDALLQQPSTAAVAPAHRDRATGMRAVHMRIRRFSFALLPRESRGVQCVSLVINSMSVWRLDAIERIGPYNESLAVDYVDIEYCLRADRLGFGIYLCADHEFAHSIGKRRSFRFLGRTLQACNYGAERHYAIGRNAMWMLREHLFRSPAVSFLFLLKLVQDAVGIVLAEDDRLNKLKGLAAGAFRGLVSQPFKARS